MFFQTMIRAALLLHLVSCGGFARPPGVERDAAIDIDGFTPPRCDPSKPLGMLAPLGNINDFAAGGMDARGATLSPDELTVYFGRLTPSNGFDILVSRRDSSTATSARRSQFR